MTLQEAVDRDEHMQDFMKEGANFDNLRKEALKEARETIPFNGIKEIKQVELATKWRRYVPQEYKDIMCPLVDEATIQRQKDAKKNRAKQREDAKKIARL